MHTLKNYLIETLIYITEAKLPEFVNKYMKAHANHPMVRENPEQAREMIAGAHKHANDHDEAMFLTQHLLDQFYKPEEDDLTMSNVVRTWRSAKAKNYIPKEERLHGNTHDDLMQRFASIPELSNVKLGVSGKQRMALRGLEKYKLGTINHPEHGKLSVYNFNTENTSDEQEREAARQNFSKLCTGGRYSWCVLANPSYMQTYSQRGSGFFTYVDEDGKAVVSHGHGDRATDDVPGGVIVNPDNSTHEYQKELKSQTAELLPENKKFDYKLANNIIDQDSIKDEIQKEYGRLKKEKNELSLISKTPILAHEHFSEEMLDDLSNSLYKKINEKGWLENEYSEKIQPSKILNKAFGERVLRDPNPQKHHAILLKQLNFGMDPELNEMESKFADHPNPLIRRAFAGNETLYHPSDMEGRNRGLSDETFQKLLADPDEGVRHNALVGHNMAGKRVTDFIFNSDNSIDEKLKAFFSKGNKSSIHWRTPSSYFPFKNLNPDLQEHAEHENFIKDPKNEEFYTRALEIDSNIDDDWGRRFGTFYVNSLHRHYEDKPSSDIMAMLVKHPNLSRERATSSMMASNNPQVIKNGLTREDEQGDLADYFSTHGNPEVRAAALTSGKANLKTVYESLNAETDPQVKNEVFNHMMDNPIRNYLLPKKAGRGWGGEKKNKLTPQMIKNRNYIMGESNDERLIKTFYKTALDDWEHEDASGELLVPVGVLEKHLNTKWKNADTLNTIRGYINRRSDVYIKNNIESANRDDEIATRTENILNTAKNKIGNDIVRTYGNDIPLKENRIKNPKKYLKENTYNNILKYFKTL
jgi:hypothetical protein